MPLYLCNDMLTIPYADAGIFVLADCTTQRTQNCEQSCLTSLHNIAACVQAVTLTGFGLLVATFLRVIPEIFKAQMFSSAPYFIHAAQVTLGSREVPVATGSLIS